MGIRLQARSDRADAARLRPTRFPVGAVIVAADGVALLLGVSLVGPHDPVGLAYAIVAFVLLVAGAGCRGRIDLRLSEDVARLLGLLATSVLLIIPFFGPGDLGSLVAALPGIVAIVLIIRGAAYWTIRAARARGLIAEPTLLVGTGDLGCRLADALRHHPEYGLSVVGFLGDGEADPLGRTHPEGFDPTDPFPVPLLGPMTQLADIVREHRIRRVIIAFDRTSEREMIPVLRGCDQLSVEIHVMPRFFELGVSPEGSRTDDIWGIRLERLRRSALRTIDWRAKRLFDVVVASMFFVLTLPVLVVSMIAVKATSSGPILFRQARVGQRGQTFELLKIRTLYVNEDGDTSWSRNAETRVTPVGRFLRRSSIDELPQLINVLRGQMSLVGPRPERPYFADKFGVAVTGYVDRQRVPAGLTGWAQVHGLRGDTSIVDRAQFDNHYVENWSLWRDVVIIARTIGAVFRGQGS